MFAQFSNEFGLDQEQVTSDLRAALNRVKLPVRAVNPPAGMTAGDLIGDLSPDVILYLYAYAETERVGFLPLLDNEVWRSFSPEVLGALPDGVFATLDPLLAEELRSKAVGSPQDIPNWAAVAPPALPESWQMDRLATAEDLTELTGARNLADIFNALMKDGTLEGPLGRISDLTLDDMRLILSIEDQCRARAAADTATAGESDGCSMLAYLDGDAMTALLTHFHAGIDGVLAEDVRLPEGYLNVFKQAEQNQIATGALVAQSLTGADVPRDVPLPDEWRFNPPRLITFSLNDLPLGVISISARDTSLSQTDLRRLVENEIVPQIESLDVIADVNVTGGETIRPDLLNAALEEEGLEPLATPEAPAARLRPVQASPARTLGPRIQRGRGSARHRGRPGPARRLGGTRGDDA